METEWNNNIWGCSSFHTIIHSLFIIFTNIKCILELFLSKQVRYLLWFGLSLLNGVETPKHYPLNSNSMISLSINIASHHFLSHESSKTNELNIVPFLHCISFILFQSLVSSINIVLHIFLFPFPFIILSLTFPTRHFCLSLCSNQLTFLFSIRFKKFPF